jgi:hypothetical protein
MSNNKEEVLHKKSSIMAEELCKGLPTSFFKFVTYVHSLGFDKKPDYQYLYSVLSQCLETMSDLPIKVLPLHISPNVNVDHAPILTGWV